jgi:hypothetical protein
MGPQPRSTVRCWRVVRPTWGRCSGSSRWPRGKVADMVPSCAAGWRRRALCRVAQDCGQVYTRPVWPTASGGSSTAGVLIEPVEARTRSGVGGVRRPRPAPSGTISSAGNSSGAGARGASPTGDDRVRLRGSGPGGWWRWKTPPYRSAAIVAGASPGRGPAHGAPPSRSGRYEAGAPDRVEPHDALG